MSKASIETDMRDYELSRCQENHTENVTIKEYTNMPNVEINGRTFVDKELFRGYALHLLTQELKDELSGGEQIGIEIAMHVISNI